MPKRKSRSRKPTGQALKGGIASIKAARERLAAARERRLKGFSVSPSELKLTAREYREMLRIEKAFGIYAPTGAELTPARKAAIRRAWDQLEALQRGAVFAEFPKNTTKAQRQSIGKQAKKAYPRSSTKGAIVTKKGLFLPKSPKQIRQPIGTLRYDKQTKLWGIDVRTRTKSGDYVHEFRYIGGADALLRKEEAVQRRFDKFTKFTKLKRNQRLRFQVGQSQSKRVFRNMADLLKYASKYRSDPGAQASFLNELTIEVVQRRKGYVWRGRGRKRRRVRDNWTESVRAFRTDNLHEVDPDLLEGYFDEDDEIDY